MEESAHHWVQTFVNQCKTGTHAELRLFCEGGHLKVTTCADLGRLTAKTGNLSDFWGASEGNPSRARRRERRAAEKTVAEKAAVDVSSSPSRPVGAVMKCLPLMTRATFWSTTVLSHPLSTPPKVSGPNPLLQWF